MKCANCGAELKVGCIYCSVCGKEAQIVSDYNLLEDDFLRDMLKEREEKIKKEAQELAFAQEARSGEAQERDGRPKEAHSRDGHPRESRPGETYAGNGRPKGTRSRDVRPKEPRPREKTDRKEAAGKKGAGKRRVKKRLIFAVAAMVLLAILIAATVFAVNHSRANSYDYQMGQAQKYVDGMNYREAQKCVNRALELDKDSIEAQLLLADIYVLQSDEGQAVRFLEELCGKHPDNPDVYRKLIGLYAQQEDYEAIHALSAGTEDETVLALFAEYLPGMPEFDTEEGVYMEEISVGIFAEDGSGISYTVDGSDPREGLEYLNPIPIPPGETVQIRAVSKNSYGIFSDEITGLFQVERQKPSKPGVSPSGGSFYEAQSITVDVPEGCKVYYTWDGSTPDTSSKQYTEPFAMPEGNNILSLIAVDAHGLTSDIRKCNYIYMP